MGFSTPPHFRNSDWGLAAVAGRTRLFRTLKGFVRRTAALVTLLSVVAAVFFAGTIYFFCPSMERAAKSCCCHTEHQSGEKPEVSRAPCCDRNTIATVQGVPTEYLRQATAVPPATVFPSELVPIEQGRATEAPRAARDRHHAARAGPAAPLFELNSVYLI